MQRQLRRVSATFFLLVSSLLLAAPAGAREQLPLWPRIAAGMRLHDAQRPEVQRWIATYSAKPRALSLMLDRAQPFLWYIVEAAELRDLPMELALLPAVESGFDAHALSASAALGLWQFVPRTGDAYGLRENANSDPRRDPVASTRAALSHLHALHQEFGDWLLALAAYNAGAGRVRSAIAQAHSRNFWRLSLPAETRNYVPRLLALASIIREPTRYGVRLPAVNSAQVTEMIEVRGDLSMPAMLRAAQVDPRTLRHFNPGMKRLSLRMNLPTLLLPPTDALVLRAELAQAASRGSQQQSDATRISQAIVLAANSQPDPLGLHSDATAEPLSPPVSATVPVVEPKRPKPAVSAAAVRTARRYMVQKGDTLFSVARRHQISVDALRRANQLSSGSSVSTGQSLTIPSPS